MKNQLGPIGEDLAEQAYRKRGFEIIGKNVRIHGNKQIGEIDIIACKDKELVFVEVKTRRSWAYGSPAEAVDYFKQRKLLQAIRTFLYRHPEYDDWNWRADVVEVDIDNQENPAIILENVIEDLD